MTPGDSVIIELVSGERVPTSADVTAILATMVLAPFNPQLERAPTELRGAVYAGRTIQSRDESWLIHLAKRVIVEQQWTEGTTAGEYLGDLRTAVQDSVSRLVLYRR